MQQKKQRVSFEATLKSSDTEEVIDIYFYRPIGYRLALLFQSLDIVPNTVTIASIFIGMIAGVFFYYENLWVNVGGMLLLMLANSLDSADGQLARMTNNKSRLGRVLDGLAGSFWFIVIHCALCLRLQNQGYAASIWILGVASGLSHMLQAQQADYYRNIHLFFIKGKEGSEYDHSDELDRNFKALTWSKNFGQKLFAGFYRNYTKQQEALSPALQQFMRAVRTNYPNTLPEWLTNGFSKMNKPLMKLTNIIQFNTRVIFLFFCLFINKLWVYFLFDLIVLNGVMIYMIWKQERISRHFHQQIQSLSVVHQ